MNKRNIRAPETKLLKRSPCPVTNALEIIGDKWTLVVIRDLFLGKRTYGEFQESPEGIPTNILADRLKRLESTGIVSRTPYQDKPVRYEYRLTEKGQDLGKTLKALRDWGLKHIPGTSIEQAEAYRKGREGRS